MEAFVEKHADVKSFANASTDVKVEFVVTFADADAASAWLTVATDSGMTKLEVELKLFNSSNLSTTNMHLFDAAGRIRKYATAREIIEDFFDARLAGYERRRVFQIDTLSHHALVLNEKVRFLEMVIGGTLKLHELTSGQDLVTELTRLALATFDGSHKYLTSMAMSSLSKDRKSALEAELASTRKSIEELEAVTGRELWNRDLAALEKAI